MNNNAVAARVNLKDWHAAAEKKKSCGEARALIRWVVNLTATERRNASKYFRLSAMSAADFIDVRKFKLENMTEIYSQLVVEVRNCELPSYSWYHNERITFQVVLILKSVSPKCIAPCEMLI